MSNSDREKRRKRRKRNKNYFLFRSSYHAVPRNFEYFFTTDDSMEFHKIVMVMLDFFKTFQTDLLPISQN